MVGGAVSRSSVAVGDMKIAFECVNRLDHSLVYSRNWILVNSRVLPEIPALLIEFPEIPENSTVLPLMFYKQKFYLEIKSDPFNMVK